MPMRHNLQQASLKAVRNKVCLVELDCHTTSSAIGNSNTIELLTSALALCHGEILTPYSQDWNCHLGACRDIVNSKTTNENSKCSSNPIVDMLVKEVTHLEAFQDVSAITKSPTVLAIPGYTSVFDGFTHFLYEVTMHERQHFTILKNGQPKPIIDMRAWQHELDQAFQMHTVTRPSILHGQDKVKDSVITVIRAQYYANLIYSYQALADDSKAIQMIRTSTSQLYHELTIIATSSISSLAHNIFWPLFIAGTEATDEGSQDLVEALLNNCIYITGFWCNNLALQFLRGYWKNINRGYKKTWIQYARQYQHSIAPFLVF